ncbi:MAG: hypothetical protein ACRCXC_10205 [Legionella sp.]
MAVAKIEILTGIVVIGCAALQMVSFSRCTASISAMTNSLRNSSPSSPWTTFLIFYHILLSDSANSHLYALEH